MVKVKTIKVKGKTYIIDLPNKQLINIKRSSDVLAMDEFAVEYFRDLVKHIKAEEIG